MTQKYIQRREIPNEACEKTFVPSKDLALSCIAEDESATFPWLPLLAESYARSEQICRHMHNEA